MELTFSVIRLILQANFASVVSVLVLIAFILTNTSFSDSINRCFILTCISLLLLIISDDMRFYYGHLPYPTFYRYVAAGTGYTLRPIIVFLLSIIASRYNIKKKDTFNSSTRYLLNNFYYQYFPVWKRNNVQFF